MIDKIKWETWDEKPDCLRQPIWLGCALCAQTGRADQPAADRLPGSRRPGQVRLRRLPGRAVRRRREGAEKRAANPAGRCAAAAGDGRPGRCAGPQKHCEHPESACGAAARGGAGPHDRLSPARRHRLRETQPAPPRDDGAFVPPRQKSSA